MKVWMAVGCGGFAGAMLRYGLASITPALHIGNAGPIPLGTLLVNLSGCLAIGLLFGLSECVAGFDTLLQRFIFTGLLGGFTTFSAFSLETMQLLRSPYPGLAFLYMGASVLPGVLLTWAAYAGVLKLLGP
ncbi:MAG TPA: CrcB family protein [Verrucomicrobiales bacterium]|nr:CrcB family protein [Verrucomicrobiales bacterium]